MTKKDKTILIGLILVAIAIIAVFAFIFIYMTTPPAQQIVTPTPTPTRYKLTLPTVFTVNDIWKGSTMTGVTIKIYKYTTKPELLESGTVTNTYTTTNPLTSGDRYWVKLSKSDTSGKTWFKYYDITVPDESSPSASNHYITLDFYSLDTTYPVKVFKPDGTLLSGTPPKYDISTENNAYPSFTVMFGPPDDDTGIMNTYDPIKTLDRQILVVVHVYEDSTHTASEKLIVSNIPSLYSLSTSDRYFGFQIDPSNLVRDKKPDGTYASEGIYSFTLSFDASGFSGTDGAVVTITLYAFTNEAYYKTYGVHPTEYIELGSFTFDIEY
jgi:hypothetical protein